MYQWKYQTPASFDDIILQSDGAYLTKVAFENQVEKNKEEKNLPIFEETCKWLDCYFSGQNPSFTPKYKLENMTPFRKRVIEIMSEIPFGKTITYSEIANQIAKEQGNSKMSSQAVGGAVGKNPIGIIIPCHRVVGKNKTMTGYAGGIKNKMKLLKLEGHQIDPKSRKMKEMSKQLQQYVEAKIFPIESHDSGHDMECIKYVIKRSFEFASQFENIDLK